jgi:GT2 family glycosyltransferase
MNSILLFTIDWANRSQTNNLIESLSNWDGHLLIIINDDGPVNYPALQRQIKLKVELLQTWKNLGFSQACNLAISVAHARKLPYLMHFNNDVTVDNLTELGRFVNEFIKQQGFVVASPTIVNVDGTVQFAGSSSLSKLSSAIIHSKRSIPSKEQKFMPSLFFHGACFIAKTEVLYAVGGFSNDYFAYREEHDIAARLGEKGQRVSCSGLLVVRHRASATASQYPQFKAFLMLRGQLLFFKKNKRLFSAIIFILILFLKTFVKCFSSLLNKDTETLAGMALALSNQLLGNEITFHLQNDIIRFGKFHVTVTKYTVKNREVSHDV